MTSGRAFSRVRERGAVMVETVLFLPVIVLLVFGVIEFSFAYQASTVLADSTRAAAREGGAVGGDDGTDEDGKDFVDHVNDAASVVLRKLPRGATPALMMVYKANDDGYPGAETSINNDVWNHCQEGDYDQPDGSCVALVWNDTTDRFDYDSGGGGEWSAATHERCTQPYDRIGVAIFVEFEPLTNFFTPVLDRSASNPLVDHAVFAFEPGTIEECTG